MQRSQSLRTFGKCGSERQGLSRADCVSKENVADLVRNSEDGIDFSHVFPNEDPDSLVYVAYNKDEFDKEARIDPNTGEIEASAKRLDLAKIVITNPGTVSAAYTNCYWENPESATRMSGGVPVFVKGWTRGSFPEIYQKKKRKWEKKLDTIQTRIQRAKLGKKPDYVSNPPPKVTSCQGDCRLREAPKVRTSAYAASPSALLR